MIKDDRGVCMYVYVFHIGMDHDLEEPGDHAQLVMQEDIYLSVSCRHSSCPSAAST